ncbi:DegT/DnrJ/EryC1/StrS family aminotransferase [Lichenicoccus sp.]|uniref:DegT/DnrJ/EryC1/StrS family aminotransferase n=1 Tax=Lichenicoccus sp. TaxID=2781899 RepID=UPI003D129BEC
MQIPFLRPRPPSLQQLGCELDAIEASGIYTNYGPVNTRFEQALEHDMFGGASACVTVCNATIGLMMAMRHVVGDRRPGPRYALMPSFTFAAAAQAADWLGLVPLFCDIDAGDWAACARAEEALIGRYGDDIAVIVPYATFGNCIDLARYEALSARTGIPIVIDAAASLGSLDADGCPFGAGFRFPIVFSMHATKTFSTGEGGVIACADRDTVQALRLMGNFGFGAPRAATQPGLNAKLSEVGALLALERLRGFEPVVRHREALADRYRAQLPGWGCQQMRGRRCAYQFMPVTPPPECTLTRDGIIAALAADGIGAAAYFAPHVAEQPFFRTRSVAGDLRETARLSRQILALPLWDEMTLAEVDSVCAALLRLTRAPVIIASVRRPASPMAQPRKRAAV